MKITSINIENFKAIDSLQFNPRMLNILVGRNNTGKTSILQATKLAFDEEYFSFLFPTHPSAALKYGEKRAKLELKLAEDKRNMVELEIERGTINELIPQLEKAVKGIFERALKGVGYANRKTPKNEERKRKAGEIERELKEWLNTETILEMVEKDQLTDLAKDSVNLIVKGQGTFLPGFTIEIMAQKLAFQIAEKLNFREFLGWEEPRNARFRYYTPFRESFEDFVFSVFEGEEVSKEEEILSSPIFIDDPIKALDIVKSDRKRNEVTAHEIDQIIKDDKIVPDLTRFNFNKLVFEGVEDDVSMDSMGDGFKALIGILASLYQQPKNTVVLLEEPEVHMHPGYLQELTKYLVTLSRTRNIQLFISTHSMDFIQCFLDLDSMSTPNSKFVKSQFYMLRLSHPKNVEVSEEIDYDEADRAIKELEWDLRGI
jgi:predicted ATP-dependent endonuclease of OLD family